METFVGTWKLIPEMTEHATEFMEHLGIPEDKQKEMKAMVTFLTITKEEGQNTLNCVLEMENKNYIEMIEIRNGGTAKYIGYNGAKVTSDFHLIEESLVDKHKEDMNHDGQIKHWEVIMRVEDDILLTISSKDKVLMITRMKKIPSLI